MNINLIKINSSLLVNQLEDMSKELFNQNSRFSKSDFLNGINLSNYVIYGLINQDDNKLVGYIYYSKVLDEAEIYQIGIKKEFQNKKLGEYLLNNSLLQLKELGIKVVFLEVRENNTYARRLYEKEGFIKVGVRKKYYDNSIDGIVYKKEL